MEQEIDDARAGRGLGSREELVEELRDLRPDAGEIGRRGEERVEDRGPHRNLDFVRGAGDPRADRVGNEVYMTHLADAASEPRFLYELSVCLTRTDPENGLDARRRRIRFRAWHRGMLEMDLIMGRFVDAELARLDEAEIDDLEKLLEAQDRDVLGWVTGEAEVPRDYDTPVFRKIRAFHGAVGSNRQ